MPSSRWPLLVAVFLGAAFLLWWGWEPLTRLLADDGALRGWVATLGAWGPAALVALGVVQVLAAPLPGYPLVLASGVLYGTFWGAVYANLGILLAGLLAFGLARRWGRPLVERFVERSHLQRVEPLLASDNPWLWFAILFLPTGDLPYFAAGLSRLPPLRYALALSAARLPLTFALTYAASHATTLPRGVVLLFSAALLVLASLVYWQQARLHGWLARMTPAHGGAPTHQGSEG